MHTNGQVFLDNRTAPTARLRGVPGIHKHDCATSIYRFVAKQRLKSTQSSVVSRKRQMQVAGHEGQVELFEGNQAVGVSQPVGELVPEIPCA